MAWVVFDWAGTHVLRGGAALVFLGLPGLVLGAGLAPLWRARKQDPVLREDINTAVTLLQRRHTLVLLSVATLVGGLILTAALAHMVTD